MKSVLLFLAVCALAVGTITFLEDRSDPLAEDPAETDAPTDEERRLTERLGQKTGSLSIRAATTDGAEPFALEVGYVMLDGTIRWRYADGMERVFSDAPLGEVEAVARAEGYPEVRQTCVVIAGVPCSVVIVLKPDAGDG